MKQSEQAIYAYLVPVFEQMASKYAQLIGQIVNKVAKVSVPKELQQEIDELMAMMATEWGDVATQMAQYLQEMASNGLIAASKELNVGTATALPFEQANQWAVERAAEMVGMKWVDGQLVPNPNAQWAITDRVRNEIRDLVVSSYEEGLSVQELTNALRDRYGFSKERAMMIAQTETATADAQGNMLAYRHAQELGIELQKQWTTRNDPSVCEECAANEEQGFIPLDEPFQSGHDTFPAHPNCGCGIYIEVIEEPS